MTNSIVICPRFRLLMIEALCGIEVLFKFELKRKIEATVEPELAREIEALFELESAREIEAEFKSESAREIEAAFKSESARKIKPKRELRYEHRREYRLIRELIVLILIAIVLLLSRKTLPNKADLCHFGKRPQSHQSQN